MTKRKVKNRLPKHLQHINLNAAGIDIGSKSHFVAVPIGRDKESVREFDSYTTGLKELVSWLKKCHIDTVAMESTGVYWIPVYEILESEGFRVLLVNARHVKNVAGRKSDVLDCQWIQELHTYGLLAGAFRPEKSICQIRSYIRQRDNLIRYGASHIQHMQKALNEMNIHLHHAVNDITGLTGLTIIRAIVNGENDPAKLAAFRHYRCKKSVKEIEKSLTGNYKPEHLFSLKQSLELYDYYQTKIQECDKEVEGLLISLSDSKSDIPKRELKSKKKKEKKNKNTPQFEVRPMIYQLCGTDLTAIDGIDELSALKIVAEIGYDMSKWHTEKHFGSWLGLSPGTKISGGKVLSRKSKPSSNRAATILRICANTLHNSSTALGAFLRRQKAKLGAPKAITATAYKLAKIIYRMLKYKIDYNDVGQDYYERRYRERSIKNLINKAKTFGLVLTEAQVN